MRWLRFASGIPKCNRGHAIAPIGLQERRDMKQEQPSGTATNDKQDWERVGILPCTATLDIPVPGFTVAELLALKTGSVVETNWAAGAEIPLKVNRATIAWGELELLGDRLGVRLTELL
jgi:flagellar motor switch/type III secretory pathway protein FliN